MATKLACTHPNCTYEGIFTIEDGEHLCMQHIHRGFRGCQMGAVKVTLPDVPSRGRMRARRYLAGVRLAPASIRHCCRSWPGLP